MCCLVDQISLLLVGRLRLSQYFPFALSKTRLDLSKSVPDPCVGDLVLKIFHQFRSSICSLAPKLVYKPSRVQTLWLVENKPFNLRFLWLVVIRSWLHLSKFYGSLFCIHVSFLWCSATRPTKADPGSPHGRFPQNATTTTL